MSPQKVIVMNLEDHERVVYTPQQFRKRFCFEDEAQMPIECLVQLVNQNEQTEKWRIEDDA